MAIEAQVTRRAALVLEEKEIILGGCVTIHISDPPIVELKI